MTPRTKKIKREMIKLVNRHRVWFKIVATVVVCLFTFNTISWALPKRSFTLSPQNLQAQSIISPIISVAGWENALQAKLEFMFILDMVIKAWDGRVVPYYDINAELDNWLSDPSGEKKDRIFNVLTHPRKTKDGKLLEFNISLFDSSNEVSKFSVKVAAKTLENVEQDKNVIIFEPLKNVNYDAIKWPDKPSENISEPHAKIAAYTYYLLDAIKIVSSVEQEPSWIWGIEKIKETKNSKFTDLITQIEFGGWLVHGEVIPFTQIVPYMGVLEGTDVSELYIKFKGKIFALLLLFEEVVDNVEILDALPEVHWTEECPAPYDPTGLYLLKLYLTEDRDQRLELIRKARDHIVEAYDEIDKAMKVLYPDEDFDITRPRGASAHEVESEIASEKAGETVEVGAVTAESSPYKTVATSDLYTLKKEAKKGVEEAVSKGASSIMINEESGELEYFKEGDPLIPLEAHVYVAENRSWSLPPGTSLPSHLKRLMENPEGSMILTAGSFYSMEEGAPTTEHVRKLTDEEVYAKFGLKRVYAKNGRPFKMPVLGIGGRSILLPVKYTISLSSVKVKHVFGLEFKGAGTPAYKRHNAGRGFPATVFEKYVDTPGIFLDWEYQYGATPVGLLSATEEHKASGDREQSVLLEGGVLTRLSLDTMVIDDSYMVSLRVPLGDYRRLSIFFDKDGYPLKDRFRIVTKELEEKTGITVDEYLKKLSQSYGKNLRTLVDTGIIQGYHGSHINSDIFAGLTDLGDFWEISEYSKYHLKTAVSDWVDNLIKVLKMGDPENEEAIEAALRVFALEFFGSNDPLSKIKIDADDASSLRDAICEYAQKLVDSKAEQIPEDSVFSFGMAKKDAANYDVDAKDEFIIGVGTFLGANSKYHPDLKISTEPGLTTCTGIGVKAENEEGVYYGLGHLYLSGDGEKDRANLVSHLMDIRAKLKREGFIPENMEFFVDYRKESYMSGFANETKASEAIPGVLINFHRRLSGKDNITVTAEGVVVENDEKGRVEFKWSSQSGDDSAQALFANLFTGERSWLKNLPARIVGLVTLATPLHELGHIIWAFFEGKSRSLKDVYTQYAEEAIASDLMLYKRMGRALPGYFNRANSIGEMRKLIGGYKVLQKMVGERRLGTFLYDVLFRGEVKGVTGASKFYGGITGNIIGGVIGFLWMLKIGQSDFIFELLSFLPRPLMFSSVIFIVLSPMLLNGVYLFAEIIGYYFNRGDHAVKREGRPRQYTSTGPQHIDRAMVEASFEIGKEMGSYGHKIDGGKSVGRYGEEKREIIMVDFQRDRVLRHFYERFLSGFRKKVRKETGNNGLAEMFVSRQRKDRRDISIPGSLKGKLVRFTYDVVRQMITYDGDYVNALANKYAGKSILIGDAAIGPRRGVCRHHGIVVASILEKLIEAGYIHGQVFYVRNTSGRGHGWAEYRDSQGNYYVIDVAQGYFGPKDGYYEDHLEDDADEITVDFADEVTMISHSMYSDRAKRELDDAAQSKEDFDDDAETAETVDPEEDDEETLESLTDNHDIPRNLFSEKRLGAETDLSLDIGGIVPQVLLASPQEGIDMLKKTIADIDGPVLVLIDGNPLSGKTTLGSMITSDHKGFDVSEILHIKGDAFESIFEDVRGGTDLQQVDYSLAYELIRRDAGLLAREFRNNKRKMLYEEYLGWYFLRHLDEIVKNKGRVILFDEVKSQSTFKRTLQLFPELLEEMTVIDVLVSSDSTNRRYVSVGVLEKNGTEYRGELNLKEKFDQMNEKTLAHTRRISDDLLFSKEGIESYLIKNKEVPIDIAIDLSLISREDMQENIETWAYLILMTRNMNNVQYIFEQPYSGETEELFDGLANDIKKAPSAIEFVTDLKSEIDSKALGLGLDVDIRDIVKNRINEGRRKGKKVIEVNITSKAWLEWLKRVKEGGSELRKNQYPVAMEGFTNIEGVGTTLRNFEAALTIGLSKAALVIAKDNGEIKKLISEGDLLTRLNELYDLMFLEDEMPLTEKTLVKYMISPSVTTRINLAISLALPPITRGAVSMLRELHENIQLALMAA